jgi:hypothetical protein
MERFKVSGEALLDFYQKNVNLEQVFSDIERDLQASNQVVCRYIVNGLELSEVDELRFAEVQLSEVESLEYLTERSEDLAGIVIRAWVEALPEMMLKTEALAARMRAQGLSGLLKSISELVQNCETLVDSVMALRVRMKAAGTPIRSSLVELEKVSKKTVLEATTALQSKDFVLLADVLEYDLNNMLQMYLEHLKTLEKDLHGEHDGKSDIEQNRSHSMGRRRLAN